MRKYDIFVSYADEDHDVVEDIVSRLEELDYRCFYAKRDIPRGASWPKYITDALDNSTMLLIIFSHDFNESEHTDREVEIAIDLNKMPVVTFNIDGSQQTGLKKYYLCNKNLIFAQDSIKAHYGELYKAVENMLGDDRVLINPTDPVDQLALGKDYMDEGGRVQRDLDKAETWLLQSAQKGNVEAMWTLSELYYETHEKDKHVLWLTKAANNGYVLAQILLGKLFRYGNQDHGTYKNPERSYKWLERAARTKDPQAFFELGKNYFYEIGNRSNPQKAFELISMAASEGCDDAYKLLGDCYRKGIGCEKNNKKAYKCYNQSSMHNHVDGQIGLADCLFYGIGIKRDYQAAFNLYNNAYEALEENSSLEAYVYERLGYCYRFGKGIKVDEKDAGFCYRNAGSYYLENKEYEKGIEDIKIAASLDDIKSLSLLGKCYYEGLGVEKDKNRAIQILQNAVSEGEVNALYYLGCIFFSGKGVKKNYEKSLSYFEQAAMYGEIDSLLYIGNCYLKGWGVEKDPYRAFDIFRHGNMNDSDILIALGKCYQYGWGTAINKIESSKKYRDVSMLFKEKNDDKNEFKYLLLAARLGDVGCQNEVGLTYRLGNDYVKQNLHKAFLWYSKAAKNGFVISQRNLAECYKLGIGVKINLHKAFFWYKKAAGQGDMLAKVELGLMYFDGMGCKKNYQKAKENILQSSSVQNADALMAMGIISEYGINGESDFEDAARYYRLAIAKGNGRANYLLGMLYKKGQGVSQNYNKAFTLFLKATENDDIDALFELYEAYRYGKGTDINIQKALHYLKEAGEYKSEQALLELYKIYFLGDIVGKDVNKAIKYIKQYAGVKTKDKILEGDKALALGTKQEEKGNLREALYYYSFAASKGIASAYYYIGRLFKDEDSNSPSASNFFLEGTQLGDVSCARELGINYHDGTGIDKDLEKAMYYFEIAAKGGDTFGKNFYGMTLYWDKGTNEDKKIGFAWLKEAADANCDIAMEQVGSILRKEGKYEDAVKYLLGAAELQYAPAINDLAYLYKDGKGVDKDVKKAFALVKKAALDDYNAIDSVGEFYENGWGTRKNIRKAIEYYTKAAEHGAPDGKYHLAMCYLNGKGVKKNRKKAIELLKASASRKFEDAVNQLKSMGINV